MGVRIIGVDGGSYGERLGICPGDTLLSVNGNEIADILDYRFYETNSLLNLRLAAENGRVRQLQVKKGQYDSLGLQFSTYLMDEERSCKNKCIFCFIDQLPKGLRKTLYFKDDDTRLSFLFGNYITLTNIDEREIERIIKMHISPVSVSVHTMNPVLRCEMMNNRFAGEALRFLPMLAAAGIKINAQLVLCPGVNDGEELGYSLEALAALGESLQSVACVPVGLSGHREGLCPLRAYDGAGAATVLDRVEAFGAQMLKTRGTRTVYPSDEFYLIAERALPPYDFYEDFPQIENGVGMFRNLEEELLFALEEWDGLCEPRAVTLVTGTRIFPIFDRLLDEVRDKCNNLKIELVPVENKFFGGSVDVTGLLTGSDIVRALKGRSLPGELLIPEVMLKADEDIFLDDMGLEALEETLSVPTRKVGSSGEALLCALLGRKDW